MMVMTLMTHSTCTRRVSLPLGSDLIVEEVEALSLGAVHVEPPDNHDDGDGGGNGGGDDDDGVGGKQDTFGGLIHTLRQYWILGGGWRSLPLK